MIETIDFVLDAIWIPLWTVITGNIYLSWAAICGIIGTIATIYKANKTQ